MPLLTLAQECGLEPKLVASTQGGEYHSACPKCGGRDRFFIQPNKKMKNCLGYYCCRQCGICGDAIQFGRDFLDLSFQDAVDRVQGTVPSRECFRFQFREIKTYHHAQLKSPQNRWLEKAKLTVEIMHSQILLKPDILKCLEQRGIPVEAVARYKIGLNNTDIWEDKTDWGIEGNGKVWLPKGILIPTAGPSRRILRLKIRRNEWQETDEFPKYVAVPGSMNGLSIIGDTKHDIMVVVESELDAYAIHNAIGNFAFVVAVGSNIKNPDNVTDYLARRVSILLICHDNDDAGKKMFDKWKNLYEHARGSSTPIGKDVGEAIKQGFDIRRWFLDITHKDEQKCSFSTVHEPKNSWSSEDHDLIEWTLKYIRERTVTRHTYIKLENEIALGPESPMAKTGKLQEELKMIRKLVEMEMKCTNI